MHFPIVRQERGTELLFRVWKYSTFFRAIDAVTGLRNPYKSCCVINVVAYTHHRVGVSISISVMSLLKLFTLNYVGSDKLILMPLRFTMQLRSLIFGVTSIFCLFMSAHTVAAMYVYPMEASLDDKGTRQLTLLSKDDDVQFVKVTLKRIENPGTPQEREIVSGIGGDTGIAVVPSKIALAAGSERIVRIVSMLPPEKETTWRIYFESVDKNTFASEITGKSSNKNISTRVGVNIIWGVLLHVLPENIAVSMKYRPGSSELLNAGTVRLPLKEIGVCNKQDECKWQRKVQTIYPGMHVLLKDFTFRSGEKYRFKYTDVTTGNIKEIEPEILP